jgi:NADPH-dependent glutamate synthase beta subunit-like oxidoreductase/pyruvate/2-oxoacid:ferredoxin oxidoreductase beta subunit
MGIAAETIKDFKGFHMRRLPVEEPLSSGHRACQGCGEILALRQVMKALGNNVIVCSATGCMEIVTSPFPQTAWRVPWLHVAFENTSAVASGVEAAYKALNRKGKIDRKDVVFLAYGGDGGTADIGLQSLSGALERGHNFVYVCLDNEAYMNTGIQRSSSTPYGAATTTSPPGKKSIGQSTWKKNLPAIAAAHGIPYVATASPAFPVDLMNKVKKAASIPGPAYIHIYSPCPTGWRSETDTSVEVARMAVLSNVFPLYEVIDGRWVLSKVGNRGVAPCQAACPAGIDVQGYVSLIAQGRHDEALALIKRDNPLPAICGRVCYHPCESVCNRANADEAVAIDDLKRFVADLDLKNPDPLLPGKKAPKNKKVAIIGGGPAGLTAGHYLAIEGYAVTLFEAMPEAGGWLRYGVPEYRLPRDVLRVEIDRIRQLGVDIRTNVRIGADVKLEDLQKQSYEAIFVAVGTQKSLKMNIPGEDLQQVYGGGDFLRAANMGESLPLGQRVAVVGGGNVAMDAARTALRLGAAEVHVLYRRSREEMPANAEEVHEAEEEGVQFHYLSAPVAVLGNGAVKEVRCLRMKLGGPDAGGRRRPIPVEGSEYTLPMDSVISAIGLSADLTLFEEQAEAARPAVNRWGTLEADPVTFATKVPGVFAGGDAVTGAATVIQAIAAGKEAAISIDRYLRGEDLAFGRKRETEACEAPPMAVQKAKRMMLRHAPAGERKNTFAEIKFGFSEQEARDEAMRCLHCGVCNACNRCDSAKAGETKTVAEYLKMQRRFRHLTEAEIEYIQARVTADYGALLDRCGLQLPAAP